MPIFEESDLQFDFNQAHWTSLHQYDSTNDFEKLKNSIKGTKGVDFIGIFDNNTLILMEVKNFRGHRIENKPRTKNGDDPLEQEVAQKMRDTLAGIIGGVRNSTNRKEDWEKYLKIIGNKKQNIQAILWLEQEPPPHPSELQEKRVKAKGGTLNQKFKRKMNWLTSKVFVTNIDQNIFGSALSVSFL